MSKKPLVTAALLTVLIAFAAVMSGISVGGFGVGSSLASSQSAVTPDANAMAATGDVSSDVALETVGTALASAPHVDAKPSPSTGVSEAVVIQPAEDVGANDIGVSEVAVDTATEGATDLSEDDFEEHEEDFEEREVEHIQRDFRREFGGRWEHEGREHDD